jgi:hypothetical protein
MQIRIQYFRSMQIRICMVLMTENCKISQLNKKSYVIDKKLQEKPSALRKKLLALQNMKLLHFL